MATKIILKGKQLKEEKEMLYSNIHCQCVEDYKKILHADKGRDIMRTTMKRAIYYFLFMSDSSVTLNCFKRPVKAGSTLNMSINY